VIAGIDECHRLAELGDATRGGKSVDVELCSEMYEERRLKLLYFNASQNFGEEIYFMRCAFGSRKDVANFETVTKKDYCAEDEHEQVVDS